MCAAWVGGLPGLCPGISKSLVTPLFTSPAKLTTYHNYLFHKLLPLLPQLTWYSHARDIDCRKFFSEEGNELLYNLLIFFLVVASINDLQHSE